MTDPGNYQFKKDQKRRYLPQSHNHPITTLTSISGTTVSVTTVHNYRVSPFSLISSDTFTLFRSLFFAVVDSYFDV